jgi:hypothetical protein
MIKRKLFLAWQMDKEKAWLEEMALQGYVLEEVGFATYTFSKQEPKNLVYQFDFQIISKKNEGDYLSCFEDWNYVGRVSGWYYFYKENNGNGNVDIYNDNQSKATMFRRLLGFLFLTAIPLYYQLFILFPNLDNNDLSFPSFYSILKILVIILVSLHAFATLKIVFIMNNYRRRIKQ